MTTASYSKPLVDWDASDVAAWLLCTTLGRDYGGSDGMTSKFDPTLTGTGLVTLDLATLTETMGLTTEQAEHILDRIAFTKEASDMEQLAATIDQLKADKQAAEEALVTMKLEQQSLPEMTVALAELALEKQAVADELASLKELHATKAPATSSMSQFRQDALKVGKRHYQEEPHQKNRFY